MNRATAGAGGYVKGKDLLPTVFQDLETYVVPWALDTEAARARKRRSSSMTEIRRFYDALLLRGPAIFEHLNGFDLNDLPPAEKNLLLLMLSLAEVSTAVEMFGEAEEKGVFDMFRFEISHANSIYS